jgi:polyhydroxyalkanoate synthesis regulator phasin
MGVKMAERKRKFYDTRKIEVAAVLLVAFDGHLADPTGRCTSTMFDAYTRLADPPHPTSFQSMNALLHRMAEEGLVELHVGIRRTYMVRLLPSAVLASNHEFSKLKRLYKKRLESSLEEIEVRELTLPEESTTEPSPVEAEPITKTEGPTASEVAAALLSQVMELLTTTGTVPDEDLLRRLGEQTAECERLRQQNMRLTSKCDQLEGEVGALTARISSLRRQSDQLEANVRKLASDRVVIDDSARRELEKIIRTTPRSKE